MSYPVFAAGDVLNASDMNAVGLWLNTSCTVTSTGGTAATASNGVITIGTGNTTVTVSSAFSATYDNYLIILNGGVGSTAQNIGLQLGSANVSGYYGGQVSVTAAGAVTGTGMNNAANFTLAGISTTTNNYLYAILHDPFATKFTRLHSVRADDRTAGSYGTTTGFYNATTSFTAFTLTTSPGTMTGGTLRVYGFRN